MANEQNLIPQNKRTKSERREIAKKAGLASGKARKRKKYIKENLEQLMLLDLKDSRIQENMRKMGIAEEDMNIQQAISVSLVQQAMYREYQGFSSYL